MKLVFFCLVLAILTSCQPRVPRNVLPPAQMQTVMWDMMLADEMYSYYLPNDTSWRAAFKRTDNYQRIFQIHHISKQQFNSSLDFYEGHPDDFKAVLDSLQALIDRNAKKNDNTKLIVPADTANRHRIPYDSIHLKKKF